MTELSVEVPGRAAGYELLSLAFLYPESGTSPWLTEKAGEVASLASELGRKEVVRAAARVSDHFAHVSDASLVEQYIELFGHSVSGDCPQYEAEYEDAGIFQQTRTLVDLSAFYKAFGVQASEDVKERWDHISIEMEFMQLLVIKEAYARENGHGEDKVRLCRDAQEAFLRDHLATWVNSFIRRASRKAGAESAYGLLVGLLKAHLDTEFNDFQIKSAPSHQLILPQADVDDLNCEECPVMTASEQGG
ncbi:MAG: molecular chaperone TorD family protein [Chloroflexi bacterium]|nr:molecular chaperone TorD family protein [Chloroflexota bacterium]